jgi:hypothetical protein
VVIRRIVYGKWMKIETSLARLQTNRQGAVVVWKEVPHVTTALLSRRLNSLASACASLHSRVAKGIGVWHVHGHVLDIIWLSYQGWAM